MLIDDIEDTPPTEEQKKVLLKWYEAKLKSAEGVRVSSTRVHMGSAAQKEARARNWAIYQVRGLEKNLKRLLMQLPINESSFIADAIAALNPLIAHWDSLRKKHGKKCYCNTCWTKRILEDV